MKKATRILALVLCAVMCLGLFVGCGNKGKQNNDTPLVVGYSPFNSKFSPFFSETAYDQDVWTMTAIGLLNSDRQGSIIMKGIEGETKAYNGTDYTYYGPADCEIVENTDGTVDYNFKLREDLKFSDGEPITIDDVIFSMYVLCDPTYDGNSTLFALPIEGMDAYRSGMDTLYNLMLAAGRDNTDFSKWEEADQTAFWADVDQAGVKFVQAIMQYCIAQGANAEGDSVSACMANWGFELPADATEADAFNAIVAKYPSLAEAVDAEKPEGTTFTSLLNDYETKYTKGIETGTSAANISGIKKTGDYSMTVSLTQVDATAIYQLGVTIAPMHYYGEKTKYDYDNNKFGFDKGDLSGVKAKTTEPLGCGPYIFKSYENGVVTMEANPTYFLGEPKTKTILFKEGEDADYVPGIVTGTYDLAVPSISEETLNAITDANSNGELTGDTLTTILVDYRGYGYLGINADLVNIDGNPGSEESKALRKGFMTVLAVYRDTVINSYYGDRAAVIQYPISNTSWAAPQPADEGYRAAYSVDADGNDIFDSSMNDEQKYDAALKAAVTFFEKAGYTFDADGKVASAPAGAPESYEILIPGNGKQDHPTYGIATAASKALETIGIKLTVNDVGSSVWNNALEGNTAQMWVAAWQSTADPDMYQVYHSSNAHGKGTNSNHYQVDDPALDALIIDGRTSADTEYRKSVYKQAMEIIMDWGVELPVYQRKDCTVASTIRVDCDTLPKDMTPYWGWKAEIETLAVK